MIEMDLFTLVSLILIVAMLIAAIVAAESKDLLSAALATGVVSLIVSILFYMLQAPDVAITEASIGAGLSVAILVFGIRATRRWEK